MNKDELLAWILSFFLEDELDGVLKVSGGAGHPEDERVGAHEIISGFFQGDSVNAHRAEVDRKISDDGGI